MSEVSAFATKRMQFDNVNLVGGYFHAKGRALEQLCEKLFDVDSPWVPVSDLVWIEWGQFAGAALANGLETFSFFIVRIQVSPPCKTNETRSTVVQAFTDCDWAMSHCREVFGFPVLLAKFSTQGSQTTVSSVVQTSDGVKEEVIATLASTDKLHDEQMSALVPEIHLVQLKQIRDVVDPSRACFQALLKSRLTNEARQTQTKSVKFDVQLSDHESLKLAADLGLQGALTSLCFQAEGFSVALEVEDSPKPVSGRHGRPFLFRPGDPQFAPDYEFSDVDFVGFRIPVARARLQAVCDQQLNDPFPDRGYRYVPADVALIVECLNYPNLRADNPPPGDWPPAGTSQRELAFPAFVANSHFPLTPQDHRIAACVIKLAVT